MRKSSQRGFSLIEVLVAVAIAAVILAPVSIAMRSMLSGLKQNAQAASEVAVLDEIETRLRTDVISADAVTVPADDDSTVALSENVPGAQPIQWRYRFSTAGGLQAFGPSGETTLLAPPHVLLAFSARLLPANTLADATNPYHALFATGWLPAYEFTAAAGQTGNSVLEIRATTAHETRVMHLLPATPVTGFGIERGPRWHAVVWRQAQTRRFLGGFGQRSTYTISAEIAYSTDDWNTSKVWCQYDIYTGLDVSDDEAQFTHHDRNEDPSTIFARCQEQTGERELPGTESNTAPMRTTL